MRVARGQGSERRGRAGGAVQSLGHVRRALQEELLRRQERGTAGAAAGARRGTAPGLAARGGGRRRHTWLLLGTPYRASAKSAARFNSTSWGRGRRQRDGGPAPGGGRGAGRPLRPPPTPRPGHRSPSSPVPRPLWVPWAASRDLRGVWGWLSVASGIRSQWWAHSGLGRRAAFGGPPPSARRRAKPASNQSGSLAADPLHQAQRKTPGTRVSEVRFAECPQFLSLRIHSTNIY